MAWPGPYSFRRNAISDLGVTTCNVAASGREMLICSPGLAAFCAGITVAAAAGTVLYLLRVPEDSSGATERLALDPFAPWELVLGIALLRNPATLDQRSA